MNRSTADSNTRSATPLPTRRTEQRYELFETIIPVQLPDAIGIVTDISATGMGIQASASLKPGTSKVISFAPPTANGPVQADCEIAWSDPLCRSGLQILHFHKTEYEKAYTQWVKYCEERTGGAPPTVSAAVLGKPSATETFGNTTLIEPIAARPTQTLFKRLAEVEKLREELTRVNDYHAALDRIVQRAVIVTHASGGAIALQGPDGIACRATYGSGPEIGARLNLSGGLSGATYQSRDAVLCNATLDDPRVDRAVCRQLKINAALLAPIIVGDECVGIIQVTSPSTGIFFDRHAHLLKGMGELAGELFSTGRVRPPQNPAQQRDWSAVAAQVKPQQVNGASTAATPAEVPEAKSVVIASEQEAANEIAKAKAAAAASVAARRSSSEASPRSMPGVRVSHRAALNAGLLVVTALGGVAYWSWLTFGAHHAQSAQATKVPQPAVVHTEAPAVTAATTTPQTASASTAAVTVPVSTPAPAPSKATPKPSRSAAPEIAEDRVFIVPAPSSGQPRIMTNANTNDAAPPNIVAPVLNASTAPRLPEIAASAPEVALSPISISRGITGGKLVHSEPPLYPELARRRHITGTVLVAATVSASGRVKNVHAISGPAELRMSCEQAVKHWRYEPFLLNGAPVDNALTVTFHFN